MLLWIEISVNMEMSVMISNLVKKVVRLIIKDCCCIGFKFSCLMFVILIFKFYMFLNKFCYCVYYKGEGE